MKINCPICKKLTLYSPANKFRPFCSKRCSLIDMGSWADDSYTISEAIDPLTAPHDKAHEDES